MYLIYSKKNVKFMINHKVDFIIVGGGIVGLCLANGLILQNWKVSLIEKNDIPIFYKENFNTNFRVSAINLIVKKILKNFNIWEYLKNTGIGYYNKIYVWDSNSLGRIIMNAEDVNNKYLGYIISNVNIKYFLYKNLKSSKNFLGFFKTNYSYIRYQYGTWNVTLFKKIRIQGKILVGSDGFDSKIREILNIKTKIVKYHQTAIITNIKTEILHSNIAYQVFLETGPLAFLPLSYRKHYSIVWTLSTSKSEKILALNKKNIEKKLTNIFQKKLGKIQILSPLLTFPLCRHHVETYYSKQSILIGDAAHVIHPLAGQGLNIGINDVIHFLQVIKEIKKRKRPLGLKSDLQRYEQKCYQTNNTMLHAMSTINTLFSNKNFYLRLFRSKGMNFIHSNFFLKSFLIYQAIGKNICL